ncbi:MAG: hypothetical protein ACI4U9_00155 [Clostridia bacterium]
MCTQNNNTQPINTQPNKRRPFAFKLLMATIMVEIIMAIACVGAKFPNFPWGDIVVGCTIFAFIVLIWLWGYYWHGRSKKK